MNQQIKRELRTCREHQRTAAWQLLPAVAMAWRMRREGILIALRALKRKTC